MKDRKGMSPVVASIILIAITVAVSIAVALRLGALTYNERLEVTNIDFLQDDFKKVRFTIINKENHQVNITDILIDNVKQNETGLTFPLILEANSNRTVEIFHLWTEGSKYHIGLTTSTKNTIDPEVEAPK